MRFTFETKDNQPGLFATEQMIPLGCLGPWMNHFPPAWWSTFRFRLFNCQLASKFYMAERFLLTDFLLYPCFIHHPGFVFYFSSQIYLLQNSFFMIKYFVVTFSIKVVYSLSKRIVLSVKHATNSCEYCNETVFSVLQNGHSPVEPCLHFLSRK